MRSLFNLSLLAVCLFMGVTTASAQVRTFKVDAKGGSRVQFVSDAPLETITGVTSKLGGEIRVDLKQPTKGTGKVTAQVASIRTGVDLRDEHLKAENWLDAKRYPVASFEIVSVSDIGEIKPNQGATATVRGKFTIHGVTKEVTTKARLRFIPASSETKEAYVKGDILRIQASFTLKLEDHKVAVPSVVRLKVSNEIKVNVDIRATAKK